MKRIIAFVISIFMVFSFAACGAKPEPQAAPGAQIANPWLTFETLQSAEEKAGFALGMPEVISDSYEAVSFCVLNSEDPILQVVYQDDDLSVEVRKAPGAGQDISGVYGFEEADSSDRNGVTVKTYWPADQSETPNASVTTFDYNDFSWSLYAPNGYWGDSCVEFLTAILGQ